MNSIRGIAARAAVCLSYTLYFLSGEQKQIRPPKRVTYRTDTSDQA